MATATPLNTTPLKPLELAQLAEAEHDARVAAEAEVARLRAEMAILRQTNG